MSLESVTLDRPLPTIHAELNYLVPTSEKPRTYTYEPPAGEPRTTTVNDARTVEITDARGILSEVSLDEEGFGLVEHHSAVRDFYDDEEVRRIYYAESEQILKDVTGADRVHIFDHTVRRRVPGGEDRGEFKHFKRWFDEIGNRPAVQRGLAVGKDLSTDVTKLPQEEQARIRKILYNQRAIPAPG